jgi:hypothetical protein
MEDFPKTILEFEKRLTQKRRWLLKTYQGAVRTSHLDYYLDEYTFRFNRRASSSCGKLFYRLIQQAAVIAPLKGCEIKGGASKHNI